MNTDPTRMVVSPQLRRPAGDPATLLAAAGALETVAGRLDEVIDATFAPLESVSGWSGPAFDTAIAQIVGLHQLLRPAGETIRAGSGTTRRLAEELAIAQTEATLAQTIADEVARLATQQLVPAGALFGQAIGVAGAAGQRADAARRQAIAEWSAQLTWSSAQITGIGDTNTDTATRGLFTAAGARLLAGALLRPTFGGAAAVLLGLDQLGSIGQARRGWGRVLALFGWAGQGHTERSQSSSFELEVKRTAGGDGLTDEDGFRGKRGKRARQKVLDSDGFRGQPGRWPKDKGAEGFIGWQGDKQWFTKHWLQDDKGALTYDVNTGVKVDGIAGFGFHGGHVYGGADGSASIGLTADGRIAWDPRYAGADAGAHGFVGGKADGGVSLGYDWARKEGRAHAGGEAMAGAEGTLDAGANVGGLGVRGGVTGYAGAGAKLEADARMKDGKIKARVEFGAALGLGVGGSVGVELDLGKAKDTVHDAGAGIAHGAKKAGGWLNPFD